MAVLTGWIDRVHRQGRLIALVVIGWGAAMTLLGIVHVLWFGLLCLAVAGATPPVASEMA